MRWNVGTNVCAGCSLAVVMFLIGGAVFHQRTTRLVAASGGGGMEGNTQASTQIVASPKQLATAARNLSEIGQWLKQMVDRYKV